MSDSSLGHDGDRNGLDNLLDHLRIRLWSERRGEEMSEVAGGDRSDNVPFVRHRRVLGYQRGFAREMQRQLVVEIGILQGNWKQDACVVTR